MGDLYTKEIPHDIQLHELSRPHIEFRHRSQIRMPAVEEVEQRLMDVLSLSLLAPRQLERRDPRPPHRLIRMRQHYTGARNFYTDDAVYHGESMAVFLVPC